jgi:DNA polymerase-3 subunit delta
VGRSGDAPSFDTLLAKLEAGKLQPVYVLYGEEQYLIERALAIIKKSIVEPDDDLAYQSMRAGESSGKSIVSSARTVPMLSDRQMVVVRQVDALTADDQALLLKYIEKPVDSTCLVLVGTKIDKRFKVWSLANKKGMVFEAAPLKEYQLSNWIMSRAKTHGLRLSSRTAQLMADSTGVDLSIVEDALERLSLYVGQGREASAQDVEAVVSSSRVRSVFDLTDAFGRRDVAVALRTLTNMLSNREAPLRLLATLATHLRRLLMAAELGRDVAGNPRELASRLKVHPFVAEKISDQVRRFTVSELRAALQRLALADLELKSARRPDELIMEETILDLCLGSRNL